jgi:hypothetical protein
MANIDIQEAQAWSEQTKLNLGSSLDGELEASIATQVISRIAQVYDVSSWVDNTTTPKLVRSIIGMLYVAWVYSRQYSENVGPGVVTYGDLLRQNAENLVVGIVTGAIALADAVPPSDTGTPVFYPTDASTALAPTADDPSLGPEKFTMGVIW